MSLSMTLIAPRCLWVTGAWHSPQHCEVQAAWSWLPWAELLLILVIHITGGDLPARVFLLHPHCTAVRTTRRTLQKRDSVTGTPFGIRGICRGTVTTICKWNHSSLSVKFTPPLLSYFSPYVTGWKATAASSPSLADPELPSEAVLPLATSITAAFGRLKLITNRNQLMTSSYKVRFVSLPWSICVCTMWAEPQCSSAKWVTWLRQEMQPLFIYRRQFFFLLIDFLGTFDTWKKYLM